jgi:hypothetical protein
MPGPDELAATNGAATTSGGTRSRKLRRRLILAAFVLVGLAWGFAIIYSVTAGGRSPERLTDAEARTIASACRDAQQALERLPQIGERATYAEKADRIDREDAILTTMVDRFGTVHPAGNDPAVALDGWRRDWSRLIAARANYVSDLRTSGVDARFVEPASSGVEPIANKMNDWILEQGTRTDGCNTGVLQAEVVEGTRVYGTESKT